MLLKYLGRCFIILTASFLIGKGQCGYLWKVAYTLHTDITDQHIISKDFAKMNTSLC